MLFCTAGSLRVNLYCLVNSLVLTEGQISMICFSDGVLGNSFVRVSFLACLLFTVVEEKEENRNVNYFHETFTADLSLQTRKKSKLLNLILDKAIKNYFSLTVCLFLQY